MAAAMNGIAVHGGCVPYGGTFLVFSDYARGAMRLSALMGVRVIYVLTHDSIGLGEDGPTHQPVEHLAMLRATPNLNVFRPADTVETAEAWELALTTRGTPSVLALTRQNLPTVRTPAHAAEPDGARRLRAGGGEWRGGGRSCSPPARRWRSRSPRGCCCERKGIGTRVVSMPCWELFAAQDEKYRRSVLPAGPVRVGGRGGGALRLGPLALRRARRGEEGGVRRDDRLRRLGADRGALPALRDHRRSGGGEGRSAGLTRTEGERPMAWKTLDDIDLDGQGRADPRRHQRAGRGRQGHRRDADRAHRADGPATSSPRRRQAGAAGALRAAEGQGRAGDEPEGGAAGARGGARAAGAPSPRTASGRRPRRRSRRCRRAGVLLLENTRFHKGEEANDPAFAGGAGGARRRLLQRRLLGGAPGACLDRGAGAAAAGLRRAADAGRARGAGEGAGQAGAAGGRGGRRRQGLDQARAARQPDRQGRHAGDRRRHGEHLPRGAGDRRRQVALRARPRGHGARDHGEGGGGGLRDPAADRRGGGAGVQGRARRTRSCRRPPARPTR